MGRLRGMFAFALWDRLHKTRDDIPDDVALMDLPDDLRAIALHPDGVE